MKEWITIVLSALLILSGDAFAAGGLGKGHGGHAAVTTSTVDTLSIDGEGGGAKGGGGNTSAGTVMGDLYGDLYVILRNTNGVPILNDDGYVQPIAADGTTLSLDDEGAVVEADLQYVQEVAMGRLNMARAPSDVLDAAYDEALAAINSASWVGNDACGRLLLLLADEYGESYYKTIDSARENLALYRQLMTTGYLKGILDGPDLGELVYLKTSSFDADGRLSNTALDQAAALLAAAGDKGDVVTVDEVVYLNTALGINDMNGTTVTDYFDFMGYTYDRNVYGDLTEVLLDGPFIDDDDNSVWYTVKELDLSTAVFNNETYASPYAGVGAFSSGSSDAVKVLTFIHERAVPEF